MLTRGKNLPGSREGERFRSCAGRMGGAPLGIPMSKPMTSRIRGIEQIGVLPACLLAVFGFCMMGVGGALLPAAMRYDAGSSDVISATFLVVLLLVAGLVTGVGAGFVRLETKEEFRTDGASFVFVYGDDDSGVGRWHDIMEYVRIEPMGPFAVVLLSNGQRLVVPQSLMPRLGEIEEILAVCRDYVAHGGNSSPDLHVQPEWGWKFSKEYPGRELTVGGEADSGDYHILHELVRRYRDFATYRDRFPPPFDFVRILLGFKRSNGGVLVLGARPDGTMVGLSDRDLEKGRARLERAAKEMTKAQVRIGKIEVDGEKALFAVFNPIAAHVAPLEPFESEISEVRVV